MARRPTHAPGTVLDCVYDGYDTIFVHGHVDEATAARAAEEFVLDHRKEEAGTWWDEVDTLPDGERSWAEPKTTEPAPTGYVLRCRRCNDAHPVEYETREGWDWWWAKRPDTCPACGADCGEEVERPRYGFGGFVVERDGVLAPAQRWGVWGFASAASDHERELHLRDAGRRGAFKLTLVQDLDELDRRRARDAAEDAANAAAVARVLELWPQSTGHYARRLATAGKEDVRGVDFGMPGLKHPVLWLSSDPDHVRVAQEDEAAWRREYARRRPPADS